MLACVSAATFAVTLPSAVGCGPTVLLQVCLIPEACGAFDREWHRQAISMLHGPQIKAGHAAHAVDNTGLYFCETSTVADVEVTLRRLAAESVAESMAPR